MDDFDFIAAVQNRPDVWVVKDDNPFKSAADVVKAAKTKVINVAGDGPRSMFSYSIFLQKRRRI